MTEPVSIRQVKWSDRREALLQVRFKVFVDEQGVPPEMEEDEYDPDAVHLLGSGPGGNPVASARLLAGGSIGRMAVLPAYRGQGIGRRMLLELLRIAAGSGLARVTLHAQCSAEGFYRRVGFVPLEGVFEEAGIPHKKMQLELSAETPA